MTSRPVVASVMNRSSSEPADSTSGVGDGGGDAVALGVGDAVGLGAGVAVGVEVGVGVGVARGVVTVACVASGVGSGASSDSQATAITPTASATMAVARQLDLSVSSTLNPPTSVSPNRRLISAPTGDSKANYIRNIRPLASSHGRT